MRRMTASGNFVTPFRVEERSIVMSVSFCVSVCACVRAYLRNYTSNFQHMLPVVVTRMGPAPHDDASRSGAGLAVVARADWLQGHATETAKMRQRGEEGERALSVECRNACEERNANCIV